MALTDSYVQVYGQFPQFFDALSRGQAPDSFTVQHLKDLGFTSSNHRALIPLLKELGFLSADGTPTNRYHNYRNRARSGEVMAEALREAYGDLFVISAHPTEDDRALIEGKFKSAHNVTDRVAKLMANTFFGLLELADMEAAAPVAPEVEAPSAEEPPPVAEPSGAPPPARIPRSTSLHYNCSEPRFVRHFALAFKLSHELVPPVLAG
jgi:hypothetical protein